MQKLDVVLLSSDGCASCARARQLLGNFVDTQKWRFPELTWREVDLFDQPEVAVKHGVTSTPAILVNGRLEFTGVPTERELVDFLENRLGP